MKQTTIKHHLDGLLALILFGVFAVSILVVLLCGADAYNRLTQRDQAAYEHRTGLQYVAARVRQADAAGEIRVEPFGETSALVLGQEYLTRVYYYDGYIMELYADASAELEPQDGEKILPASDLSFTLSDDLLNISFTDSQGSADTLLLTLLIVGAITRSGLILEI